LIILDFTAIAKDQI